MNIAVFTKILNNLVTTKVDKFCASNPMINLFKPVIKRVIDNNSYKIYSKLNILADSEGNIDVENILPEMIETLKTMEPYNLKTETLGDIVIGKGSIILNIPMTDRRLVIDSSDLEELITVLKTN